MQRNKLFLKYFWSIYVCVCVCECLSVCLLVFRFITLQLKYDLICFSNFRPGEFSFESVMIIEKT